MEFPRFLLNKKLVHVPVGKSPCISGIPLLKRYSCWIRRHCRVQLMGTFQNLHFAHLVGRLFYLFTEPTMFVAEYK